MRTSAGVCYMGNITCLYTQPAASILLRYVLCVLQLRICKGFNIHFSTVHTKHLQALLPLHLPPSDVLKLPLSKHCSPSCLSQHGVSHVPDSALHKASSASHAGGLGQGLPLHVYLHWSYSVYPPRNV
jgi:hypothetical protein